CTALSFIDGYKEITERSDNTPVLFDLDISTTIAKPFAYLHQNLNGNTEQEVLLSIGLTFRTESVETFTDDGLMLIKLIACSDEDCNLKNKAQNFKKILGIDKRHQDIKWGYLLFVIGEYELAKQHYQILLAKLRENDHRTIGTIYYDLGRIYYETGDYQKALEYYNKSLEYAHLNGDYLLRVIELYNSIAEANDKICNYENSLKYYTKSLDTALSTKPSDFHYTVNLYSRIGKNYNNKGQYSLALDCCNKALQIRSKFLNYTDIGLVAAYNNIALIHSYNTITRGVWFIVKST
ncbi:unnamed protein product, partial [Didymodactylos carnosus]